MAQVLRKLCTGFQFLQAPQKNSLDMVVRGILISKLLLLCFIASARTDTILLHDEQDSGIMIEEPQCITVFLSEHDGYLALYQYRWVDGDRVYIVNDINSSSYISPNEGGGMAELKPNEAKVYIHRRKRFFIVD